MSLQGNDDTATQTTGESPAMSSTMTTAEVATSLKTTSKTLRRFLRQEPSYANAGSGGRYTFTSDDLPQLQERFTSWDTRPRTTKGVGTTLIEDAPGLPIAIVRDPANADVVRRFSEARVDRLEAALKANGLHISQLREAEERRWAQVLEDDLVSA